jgi:Glycosyltransferase family 87
LRQVLAKIGDQSWVWMIAITLLSVACVAVTLRVIPRDKLAPDFIQFWTAGKIVASRGNPYDATLQARIQQELGWDRARDGLGIYDYLPYYYPPWFALAFVPLLALAYDDARVVTYFVNVVLLFVSGYVLSGTAARVSRTIPLVVVPLFVFSPASLGMGQTAIVILFLTALEWKLLEREDDRAAGAALAFLATKPQLGAVLVISLLVWAARQRRWRVVRGFAVTMGALALASALIVPLWPLEMIKASAVTPPPTTYYPRIGTTWLLALRTVGLQSWMLWAGYLALAVPFLALVVRAALDRSRPVSDVIAMGILAAFIVAPYARHYDFPILLVPLFVLMGGRLPELAGTALMMALLVLPYVHMGAMMDFRQKYPTSQRFPECTFLWVPAILTGAWLIYEARAKERRSPENVAHQAPGQCER